MSVLMLGWFGQMFPGQGVAGVVARIYPRECLFALTRSVGR